METLSDQALGHLQIQHLGKSAQFSIGWSLARGQVAGGELSIVQNRQYLFVSADLEELFLQWNSFIALFSF